MAIVGHIDLKHYEGLIKASFGFVQNSDAFSFSRTRMSGGEDVRDSTIVTRIIGRGYYLDVSWNEYELSLSVLVKFELLGLNRDSRYAYFEPLVEFLTEGKVRAVVPYIKRNMRASQICEVIDSRRLLFSDGLSTVMPKLAKRVNQYSYLLDSVNRDQLVAYNLWMRS